MDKLELKYVIPYYSYELGVIVPDEEGECLVLAINNESVFIDSGCDYPFEEIKLVLFSLSSIKEEIVIGDDVFIPYERLFEKWLNINNIIYGRASKETQKGVFDAQLRCVYEEKGYDQLQHWIYQDLIKWQFDLFRLIKYGFAVDVNTLHND